jgi:NADPH:quinone reductase
VKAVRVVRNDRPMEAIEVQDVELPEAGPGAVRIAVSAASLNFGDIARCRGGVASVMAVPPFTLGMDVCGVVDAAGEGAEEWLGRRVVGITTMALGGMAEAALAPMTGVFDAPPELDDVEAAAFTLPFHTSYLALHTRARLRSGETLLVVGGASAVGTAAIQLGRAAGAEVVAIAGGPEKTQLCEQLGAVRTIDHQSEDIFDAVMDQTDGRGTDVVCDLVGGAQTETIWTCVAREGRYLPVGFNDDPESGLTGRPLRKVSMGNFSVLGVMLSYNHLPLELRRFGLNPFPPETGREVHAALCALVAQGTIRPVVRRRVRMIEVGAALEDHEARRTSGRTVIDLSLGT